MDAKRYVSAAVLLLVLAVQPTGQRHAVSAQKDAATLDATSGEAVEQSPLPSFAIYPKETGPRTFFEVTQNAGANQRYTLVLANTGGTEQEEFVGRTFAVDVRTKVNGGLESGGPNELKTGTTTWLDYPNDILTLQPGEGIERTFTVTVPDETLPGQYVTALCFETAEPLAIPGVPNLKQNLRQTIAFYVTVPGERQPRFSIKHLQFVDDPTWSGVQAEVVNSGNVHVRPEGRITISDRDGAPLFTNEIALGAFYAGQSGLLQTGFGSALPTGEFLVTIELRDPATGATAIVENQRLATTTSSGPAVDDAPKVAFDSISVEILPDLETPQYLSVEATIVNSGELVSDAELSLQVVRDGILVENYVIVGPLSLAQGETQVESRYVPLGGWQAGVWTFSISVQQVDRQTGVARVLSTVGLPNPIVIP